MGLRREFEAEGVLSKVDGREFLRRIGIVGELDLDCWMGTSVVGVESEKGEFRESRDVGSNAQ